MSTVTDKPLFDTCDENRDSHYTDSAWGFTWCECNHTAIVEQYDPTHYGIDPDSLPVWWNRALREALDAAPDSGFDLSTAWAHLRELAHDLAADGTWERWDEFGPHVLGLDPGPAEEFLKLLVAAGIADAVVSSWEHRDGKDTWHGKDCGCIQISLSLNAERAEPEPRTPERPEVLYTWQPQYNVSQLRQDPVTGELGVWVRFGEVIGYLQVWRVSAINALGEVELVHTEHWARSKQLSPYPPGLALGAVQSWVRNFATSEQIAAARDAAAAAANR